jgi:hypothetical protein
MGGRGSLERVAMIFWNDACNCQLTIYKAMPIDAFFAVFLAVGAFSARHLLELDTCFSRPQAKRSERGTGYYPNQTRSLAEPRTHWLVDMILKFSHTANNISKSSPERDKS